MAGFENGPVPAGVERGILTRVNAEGWHALKLIALDRGVTLQALAVEALNDMLAKHGRRRVVKTPAGKRGSAPRSI